MKTAHYGKWAQRSTDARYSPTENTNTKLCVSVAYTVCCKCIEYSKSPIENSGHVQELRNRWNNHKLTSKPNHTATSESEQSAAIWGLRVRRGDLLLNLYQKIIMLGRPARTTVRRELWSGQHEVHFEASGSPHHRFGVTDQR